MYTTARQQRNNVYRDKMEMYKFLLKLRPFVAVPSEAAVEEILVGLVSAAVVLAVNNGELLARFCSVENDFFLYFAV